MNSHTNESSTAAVAALRRKRNEISGKINTLLKQVADLRSDLLHIDHALRMIDPEYMPDSRTVKVKFSTAGYFDHGELSRRIYDGLRRSKTITAAELTDKAVTEKKISDPRIRNYFVSRFLSRLAGMAKEGKLFGYEMAQRFYGR